MINKSFKADKHINHNNYTIIYVYLMEYSVHEYEFNSKSNQDFVNISLNKQNRLFKSQFVMNIFFRFYQRNLLFEKVNIMVYLHLKMVKYIAFY